MPGTLHSPRKVHLLLVDDNAGNRLVLRTILEELKLDLVEARSGEEALKRLQRDDFAGILLDVEMPGMSGFEAAELIRREKRSQHTPIIFLSTYGGDESRVAKAYSLGAVDYLVKPLVPEIVQAKVRALVDLYEQAEQARREADQLRLLIDGTREHAIYLLDPTGHVVTWNQGAERIKGYRADEILGRDYSCFFPPEDVRAGKPGSALATAAVEGEFTEEAWRVRKDGSRFWASVVITGLRKETGELRGFSKVTRDVTERKQAEENRQRLLLEEAARSAAEARADEARRAAEAAHARSEHLRVTLESVGDAILVTDAEGRVTLLNPVAEALTGWNKEEASAQPLETVFQIVNEQTRRPAENPVARVLREGVVVGLANHTVLIGRDGTRRPIDDSAAPIKDSAGRVIGVILVFRDVSERKRLEEGQQQRIRELAEADRNKNEFLAMLAHELRNPLAPLSNALQILRMSEADSSAAERAREMMERQLHHLVRLVDDLLDMSRIMSGKIGLRKEKVEAASVITRAIETIQPLVESQGHQLHVALPAKPVWLHGDLVRLAQVIGNLLHNSAKYMERGGQIWLSSEKEGDTLVVRVRDAGIGIDPDVLPCIFDLFTQANHSASRAQGGLGIGLTLVRRLVEMHSGSVSAFSEGLGKGSEFVVRLPVVSGAAPAHEALTKANGATPSPPVPGHRVLVVDDNRDAADSLAVLLRILGQDVQVAHDGPAALEAARRQRPDVVFLDIGMPGMDGYDVARGLRRQPGLERVKLIALTGWGQEEDRQRSQEAGIEHHLVKPAELEILKAILATV
jgi:two-component system CheB/CheR fusion protein